MLRQLRNVIFRAKFGAPVIVVSGLPRSGTSMMMNMLGAAGLEVMTDKVREADIDNPKGYFEDERVKNLERDEDRSWLFHCRGKVIKVISFLLRHLPGEHHYKVIFMHRDLEEVIASQNKMLAHRDEKQEQVDDEKMIEMYRVHLRKTAYFLERQRNVDCLDVHYRAALDDPREQARRVAAFLGGDLDLDKMVSAVDRSLYRNRRQDQRSARV